MHFKFFFKLCPYLQLHPYANEVQERVMPRPGIVVPILLPQHYSRLSTTILTFLEAVEPYLHRHPTPTQDPGSPPRLT